jgi:hypothetical protein
MLKKNPSYLCLHSYLCASALVQVVLALLDLGADPSARGACGRGVLGEAAYAGHVHVIRALLTWQAKAGKGTGLEWEHEGKQRGVEEVVSHDEERIGRGARVGEEGRERREGKGQDGSRSVQGEGCTCAKAGGVCEGVGEEEGAVRPALYWAIRGGRAEAVRCLMVHTGVRATTEERRAATGHCLEMIEVGAGYMLRIRHRDNRCTHTDPPSSSPTAHTRIVACICKVQVWQCLQCRGYL